MTSKCEPLCHFSERFVSCCSLDFALPNFTHSNRLYFTTFQPPLPTPRILNELSADPGNLLRIRVRPKFGSSISVDNDATYYFFTIDDQLLYFSFYQDWGPLNIAMVYKACILIHELLEVPIYDYSVSFLPLTLLLSGSES
jgi:hypothetical protein